MDHELSIDEIEVAYQQALETAEAAESLFPDAEALTAPDPAETEPEQDTAPPPRIVQEARQEDRQRDDAETLEVTTDATHLQPGHVIEALLFVGGAPLPARKMGEILGGSLSHEQVDQLIERINARYREQHRPYEIRLVEGGYRMSLLSEFEPVRQKVYGQGPREVKLAQDALEILALVAYRQPIARQEIEETGKKNVSGLLRQLLRRELITLQRGEERGEETYETAPRFLQLFGLGSIDDLPQAADFQFK
jgi:segregation and condensation protein B